MNRIIGKCSLCGGNVTLPEVWMGINPPVPTCQSCRAVEDSNKPVIPMKRPNSDGRVNRRLWENTKWMAILVVLLVGCSEPPKSDFDNVSLYLAKPECEIQFILNGPRYNVYSVELHGKRFYVTVNNGLCIGPEIPDSN